ncbi:MAG: FAD-dependent oxidoreductase [Burkholderiaceae bacterium]|nr:FAD-dependent oxidoreductase [Burkholderiaceae bacterium]
MTQAVREEHFDVVVVGAGASGVVAAIAAARNGARTLLVDAGTAIGGELLSGINILGTRASNGDKLMAGIGDELLEECRSLGGFVAEVRDFRPLYFVSFDPEYMKVAVASLVERAGVEVRLYTVATEMVVDGGQFSGVIVHNKLGRSLIRAKVFIDCTGDADLVHGAGGAVHAGDGAGAFQSLTLVFRMIGVDTPRLLDFMRSHPENFAISEEAFASIAPTREEAIQGLYEQGLPKLALAGTGPLLTQAIDAGELYETSIVAIAPLSMERREVSINSTKITNVDPTDTRALSRSYAALMKQVMTCARFLNQRVPGFEEARFSGLAPRIGIREGRRIVGDHVLDGEHITQARKCTDGVARGGHPIDVWVPGRGVHWKIVRDGGRFDIPFGCLLPQAFDNLLVAGRCLSSTREGQASVRVMGTCMAVGQAAGTAAALAARESAGPVDLRQLPIAALRATLTDQGALI